MTSDELDRYFIATSIMHGTIETTFDKKAWLEKLNKNIDLIKEIEKGNLKALDNFKELVYDFAIEECEYNNQMNKE